MDKVKIAVIGAGNIANAHIKAYREVEGAEVYALCDINEERLNETGELFGLNRRYTDLDTMLRELPELDAADVCVWNCNHANCSVKALNAGLHVLCEKPMACSADEARQMSEAAKRNNRLLMIGFVLRFSNETKIAKDFISGGFWGDIYYSKAQYIRRHGSPGGWFANKMLSGGGPVIDLGVHVIDLMRYLMGNPKPISVYAATFAGIGRRDHLKTDVDWKPRDATDEDISDVEDFAVAMIRYSNGAVTQLEASYSINGEDSTKRQIFGTKAGLDLSSGVKLWGEYNNYLADIDIKTKNYKQGADMFVAEMSHFVDCIQNGTKCVANAEDGMELMRILDAIYKSAREGHEVLL